MGIKVFREPQVLEEDIIIEFNLKDPKAEPKITKKYYYKGKEISKSRFYLLHLELNKDIALKVTELQSKETNSTQGIILTGLNIFKYVIDMKTKDIKFVSQIDIVEYKYIPEIQIEGDIVRVILHKKEIFPAEWQFKPIQIDKELENGLKQYLLDVIHLTRILASIEK